MFYDKKFLFQWFLFRMFLGQKIIRTFINILALADFLFLSLLDRKNLLKFKLRDLLLLVGSYSF